MSTAFCLVDRPEARIAGLGCERLRLSRGNAQAPCQIGA